jgi:hypothetical protein
MEERPKLMATSARSYADEDIRTAQRVLDDLASASQRAMTKKQRSLLIVDLTAAALR